MKEWGLHVSRKFENKRWKWNPTTLELLVGIEWSSLRRVGHRKEEGLELEIANFGENLMWMLFPSSSLPSIQQPSLSISCCRLVWWWCCCCCCCCCLLLSRVEEDRELKSGGIEANKIFDLVALVVLRSGHSKRGTQPSEEKWGVNFWCCGEIVWEPKQKLTPPMEWCCECRFPLCWRFRWFFRNRKH